MTVSIGTDIESLRPLDDLPLFDEIDRPDFGTGFDSLAADLFARDHQGPMRTSAGGYTGGSLFVYRNEEIRSLMVHPGLGNQPIEAYACPYEAHTELDPPGFHRLMDNNLFTMQPPRHGSARKLISRRFTARSLARFAEPVDDLVAGLLTDACETEEVDFRRVADAAMVGFWQIVLGWSSEEAKEACALAAISQRSNLVNPSDVDRREIDRASFELLRCVSAAVSRQIDGGTREFLRELVADHEEMDADDPGRPDVLEELFGATLLDGLHSLGAVIASVVHGLLGAPEALASVRDDPGLVSAAFLEGVRLNPAVSFTQRAALQDIVVGDVSVPAGTPVSMAWLLGNRDPEVFDDPNTFRLERSVRRQTTFGGGFYICPGRHIVKMLAESMLRGLTAPSLEIERNGEARWVPATGLHELESMPVAMRRV